MDSISSIILAGSLGIIMLGMGLSLTLEDFARIFVKPKAIFTGLFAQVIVLPVLAYGLVMVMDLPPAIAIGVFILAACPGGATSNLITHLGKGDTALSVSLTAISSLITLFSIPFIINIGLQTVLGKGTDIQLDVVRTIGQVFLVNILPISIGMIIRKFKPEFADKMDKPVRKASGALFILIMVGLVVKERAVLLSSYQKAGVVSIGLNVLTMAAGYLMAKLMKLPFSQKMTIAIEGGIQNGALGITIATLMLFNTEYAIVPAVYGLSMFFTALAFIWWTNRRSQVIAEK